MLFSSITFIFMFLPLVLFFYLITKKELHNPVLLIASIIFYAWAEPRYLAIMLLTIFTTRLGAAAIEKCGSLEKAAVVPFGHNKRLWVLITTICVNLGVLIYFKYFNFIIENFNNLFGMHIKILDIVMPIGISFYTFQALSYLIDVYKGECRVQKDIYKLALYICLFPQLVAGPIVKYKDVEEQISSRTVNFEKTSLGVKRFIIGLSKKVLIANVMGLIADKVFVQDPHALPHFVAWLGAAAYTFQIYFDFSGYSDMAIGLGLIFGFKFMENFNYPYISKSITEFWRRWHISLSTWFKQYIYIPLGGNRNGMLKTLRNLGFVFLLTGIWHGASWTFIIWGCWHGFFIILEKIFNIKKFGQNHDTVWIKILRHLYCILVIVFGWVIFRADTIKYSYDYIRNMLGILRVHTEEVLYPLSYYIDRYETAVLIVAIICSMPVFNRMPETKNKLLHAVINLWLLLLFIFSAASIAADTYNPFIYFRF